MSSKNVVWVVYAERRDEEACYFEMAFSDHATALDICDMGKRDAGQHHWWVEPVLLDDTDTAIKMITELMEA